VKCWRKGAGDMADGCFISWECDERLLVTWRELLVWVEGWFLSLPEWDSFSAVGDALFKVRGGDG